MVYSSPNFFGNVSLFSMPSKSYVETKVHDPLIVIASYLAEKPNLTRDEKINILEVLFNARHKAQDRLWNGEYLQTSEVITKIQILSQYRIAYTEKNITIKNISVNNWDQNQEAIYTFTVPEGTVATSLSLWINGKFEKSILTSSHKADSAYKQIVGVETHDPSVVHWQEGNRISVRVFPCTPVENRIFKIGFTSPLKFMNNELIYENISFEGPSEENAIERMQINFDKDPINLQTALNLVKSEGQCYTLTQKYNSDWSLQWPATPLSQETFDYLNHKYSISDYKRKLEDFDPQKIYLDINNSWTGEEICKVFSMCKGKEIYINQNHLNLLTDQNITDAVKWSKGINFNLFPFYKLNKTSKSLIITKSTPYSPNLDDLKNSEFIQRTKAFLNDTTDDEMEWRQNLHLYNLGSSLSTYLRTMKELRLFNYEEGSLEDLRKNFTTKKFCKTQEDSNHIVIDNAKLVLTKSFQPELIKKKNNGPDHLLRLYAYNDIMRKIGPYIFNPNYDKSDVVEEAEQAYVVSPVSSLIVLEKKSDYDRFGIKKKENSLDNASSKSSGAVPEPEEWALILIGIIGLTIFVLNQRKTYKKIN